MLGGFCLDSRRQFQHDRRHLKFYKMRAAATGGAAAAGAASSSHSSQVSSSEATYKVNIDLNEGVERANRKDDDETAKEGLSNMFRWILVNR